MNLNYASPISPTQTNNTQIWRHISGSTAASESGDSQAAAKPCCPAVTPQQFLAWLTDLGTLAIIGFCFALITFGCNVAHLVDEQNKATYDHDRLSFGLIG